MVVNPGWDEAGIAVARRPANNDRMSQKRDWPAAFDTAFRNVADNAHRRIWRAVFGDEYPEGIDPYSLVSRTELDLMTRELRVGPGDLLGDLGCGRGGPGLWLAAKTGADLLGVDISAVALQAAAARAEALGLKGQARYQQGSFADTGLSSGALDAIVSIDALIFAPDKRAAVSEFARVLRPGARLAVTTWDYHRQPVGRPPQVDDHRPLLEAAGFTVRSYTDTTDWRHRMTAISAGLAAAAEEIAEETGEEIATVRAGIGEARRTIEDMTRRVLILADRD
jgi:SAM-dependent methyltransferase